MLMSVTALATQLATVALPIGVAATGRDGQMCVAIPAPTLTAGAIVTLIEADYPQSALVVTVDRPVPWCAGLVRQDLPGPYYLAQRPPRTVSDSTGPWVAVAGKVKTRRLASGGIAIDLGFDVEPSCEESEVNDAEPVLASDKSNVEASTAAFHQALRTNDLETFMSFVAEDVFFMPPGEPPVRGRDAIRKWMAGFLAQYRTSSLILADREVLVGNGWAVELGTFEWALQPAAGGPAVADRGNYMQVWKQQSDKKWQFAREVYNSSVPPAPAAAK